MKTWGIVIGLLVLCSAPIMAFEKGDVELSPMLRMTSADDLKTTDLMLEGGYHFDEKNQLTLSYEYRKEKYGSAGDSTGGFLGIGYDLNLINYQTNNHLPFIGGGIKLPQSDYKDYYDRILYIHGGFKSFLVENKVAIRTSLEIEQYAGAEGVDNDTAISLRLGLLVFFNIAQKQEQPKAQPKAQPKTQTKPKKK